MSMRVWVTGYEGFMGPHLVDALLARDDDVLATYLKPPLEQKHNTRHLRLTPCDVRDSERVLALFREFQPKQIYHLAAQSYPTVSWDEPALTLSTNIHGTLSLLQALRSCESDCRLLNACSSAQYGQVSESDVPVRENHAMRPLHPYGVSKVAQELLAYQYFQNFGVRTVSVRIFNTTGPGKTGDACSDFVRRLVLQEQEGIARPVLRVGNLETRRAITDVRDVVSAFQLALDTAEDGVSYNLSGDRVYRMADVVQQIAALYGRHFDTEVDPKLLRPADEPVIFGDSQRFNECTGWKPRISLERTLGDMLYYWRSRPQLQRAS